MLNRQKGFTLVEILAVMMVFGIIGGISAGILVTTLRTSNKSNMITQVKQNGDYAISQIAKTIRNSYSLTYPPLPCGDASSPTVTQYISVVDSTGSPSTISCVGAVPSPAVPTIPPNSITLQQGSSAQTSLIDPTLVQTSSCSFTCIQATTSDYPVIQIAFSLLQKGLTNFSEQVASASAINFSTSVVFRNYQR